MSRRGAHNLGQRTCRQNINLDFAFDTTIRARLAQLQLKPFHEHTPRSEHSVVLKRVDTLL